MKICLQLYFTINRQTFQYLTAISISKMYIPTEFAENKVVKLGRLNTFQKNEEVFMMKKIKAALL